MEYIEHALFCSYKRVSDEIGSVGMFRTLLMANMKVFLDRNKNNHYNVAITMVNNAIYSNKIAFRLEST